MLFLGIHALVVPLSPALAPAAVPQRQRQHTARFGIGSDSALHAFSIEDEVIGSRLHLIDESVVQENIRVHQDAIRKSEVLFYGYFTPQSRDGITEWDIANMPSGYTHYSLHSSDTSSATTLELTDGPGAGPKAEAGTSATPTATETASNFSTLYESMLLELDRRTVPPPFTADDLARVSLDPILSAEECQEIIDECEDHYYGWGSSQERYGTAADRVGHMIKLEDLSFAYSLVNFELLPRLFPAIIQAFPTLDAFTTAENLRLGGCRVVKYDASEGRVELGMHRDGLLLTANIALNSPDEYAGGGTIVEGANIWNDPIRLDRGHVLLHPGDVLHSGAPITAGTRYVLVLFLFATDVVPHDKYCQDRMEKDVERARAISLEDESRAKERDDLFASAAKHCADALAFSSSSFSDRSDTAHVHV